MSTQNVEDTIIALNPKFNLRKGDINAKLTYVTKRRTRNIVMEVSADTRRLIWIGVDCLETFFNT
jgi:hypothetical protein